MKLNNTAASTAVNLNRRRFVQGLVASGVMLSTAASVAAPRSQQGSQYSSGATVLTGTEFDLVIAESEVNFTGKARIATTINGSIPAPTLHWREGDTVTIRVRNRLKEATSIHWHGMILPFEMDGVPGVSFAGIPAGETFTYTFTVQQSGTYWYHSHSGTQEMTGMYGAIVITPKEGETIESDRDYVISLSDWTDEDPFRILEKLKTQGDYYNYNQPTLIDLYNDVKNDGLSQAMSKRSMWNKMRMSPTDLADLSGETLTYLMNGVTPAGNWSELFSPGERIRLRLVNASSNTIFDVRIPNLKMTVVQADGVDVEPVSVDELRFGSGETYDVIIEPTESAYTIFAEPMDRTGYVSGTLSTAPGLTAAVPAVSKPQRLTMVDMMGAMAQGDMAGMDHGAMTSETMNSQTMDSKTMEAEVMDHSNHVNPLIKPSTQVRHASTESGPSTDMRVDMPRTNHDDPGVGLRNNGRRVLTLADLKTVGGSLDHRVPVREIELHLTGNMERYTWSLDGLAFGKSTPIHFNYGERLRVILHNDTMMTHPMHLHGMWSELENEQGEFMVRKHTFLVQPAQRISFQVTADAFGRWAWHCHLLFHMDAGMFRQVVVS